MYIDGLIHEIGDEPDLTGGWDDPHRIPSDPSQGAPNEGHDEHYEQANRGDGWENPHLDQIWPLGELGEPGKKNIAPLAPLKIQGSGV